MADKRRLKIVFIAFIIVWILIVSKIFNVQVLKHDEFEKLANAQYKEQLPLLAKRGFIFDRDLEKVAYNDISYDIKLEIKAYFEHPEETRTKFEAILKKHYPSKVNLYKSRIDQGRVNNRHTIVLIKKASEAAWVEIQTLRLKSVYAEEIKNRVYSEHANLLVGYVDIDNKGISGFEKQYDKFLKGQNGFKIAQRDALGRVFSRTDYQTKEPIDGNHLVLTISKLHQSILEEELNLALTEYKAKSVFGLIMDPHSGEIIAISSSPSFNSNDRYKANSSNEESGYNRAAIDIFEPGSTFKIVTAAAALEEGIKHPDDIIDCENGRFKYGPKTFRDDQHRFGKLTFREVIEKSSNIGFIKVGLELGKETMFRYVRDFGFGNLSESGFSGESAGLLSKPNDWSKLTLPSISFGHEIGVTAIQLAQAYSVIANGGYLMKPYIIKERLSTNLDIIDSTSKQVVRRVLSEKTTQTLTELLTSVVKQGTGTLARSQDFTIAGKTGTAQKYDFQKRSWDTGKVVASFAGFFPAENPKYVSVIVVDEPRYKHLNYGGWTAAPTFKRIAKKIIGSSINNEIDDYETDQIDTNLVYIPDVVGLSVEEATDFLSDKFIPFSISGEGGYVIDQDPLAGEYDKATFDLIEIKSDSKSSNKMPNLKNLTMREAIRKLKRFKNEIKFVGSGIVHSQSIKAGKIVKVDEIIVLSCKEKK